MPRLALALAGALGILLFASSIHAGDDKDFEKPVQKLLETLRKGTGQEVKADAGIPGRFIKIEAPPSKEDLEIRAVLEEKKLYFEKKGWTLEEIGEVILKEGKVEARFSAGLREQVRQGKTIPKPFGSDLEFDEMLGWLSKALEVPVRWRIASGVLHVTTAGELDDHREELRNQVEEALGQGTRIVGDRLLHISFGASPDTARTRQIHQALKDNQLTCHFDETPFEMVLTFMKDIVGIAFVVSDGVKKNLEGRSPAITLQASATPLSQALDDVLKSTGERLAWRVRHDGIHILTEEEAKLADKPPSFLLVDVGDLLGMTAK